MPDATFNGCKHHWDEFGSGEPLVMLHGASGSSRALTKHAEALASSYRVITPDMRGMGQSERVAAIPASAWVDDLLALLDHLKIPRAHIYGITVGNRVAQRFAVEHPDRVSSLILDMPIVYQEEEAQAEVGAHLDVAKLPAKRKEELERLHGAGWEEVAVNYQNYRSQPEWQQYFDLRQLLVRIAAPTLIMRGDVKDGGYSAEHAFMLYRGLQRPTLWIRPNSGGGLLGSHSEEAYGVIRGFLAGTAA